MIRAALVLLALALPAQATQDQWPALFDVTDVASDDVLNIRAAPDASSEIIGFLAHDATDVELIEPSERHTWARVNTAEGSGWVSLRYVARQPGQWFGSGIRPATCFGTEPFWDISITDGALVWRTPEDPGTPGRMLDRIEGVNRFDREAFSLRLDDGRDGVAVLGLAGCSDFMSDRAYGITADLVIGTGTGATLYSGCCSLSP